METERRGDVQKQVNRPYFYADMPTNMTFISLSGQSTQGSRGKHQDGLRCPEGGKEGFEETRANQVLGGQARSFGP